MMPRGFLAVSCCVVSMLLGVSDLSGCGDKFLVGMRGGQQLSYLGVVHPTRILIYWHVDPENPSEEADESVLETSLEEVGHSVAMVKDPQSLYREAVSGGFEVILMEVGDAREEQGRLEGVSPGASILPVMHFPTRREFSAAKKEFGQAVKTPTTLPNLLNQIEKARKSSENRETVS